MSATYIPPRRAAYPSAAGPVAPGRALKPPAPRHALFVLGEALLLIPALVLAAIVARHPAPLPGDVGLTIDEQRLLLPHRLLTQALDAVSTINWPLPSAITLIAVTVLLVVMRRRVAAAVGLLVAALADGSSFLTNQLVRRPRPSGHGIHVLQHITNYFSFPSGHVIHALAFFGFLLFVTYKVRRRAAWLWLVRLALLLLIVLMAPSRVLEGEHWPSDVLEGLLYGAFWLVLGIHVYAWIRRRWPHLLGRHEEPAATS